MITEAELDELKKMHEAATAGPWEHDTDGTSNGNGERLRDFASGPRGELFDTSNAMDREIHHEPDDDGIYYFDPVGRANIELACALRNAFPELEHLARFGLKAAAWALTRDPQPICTDPECDTPRCTSFRDLLSEARALEGK